MVEMMESVDMAELIKHSDLLSTMINQSAPMEEYLQAKRRMNEDAEAQQLFALFEKKKVLFEDVQRFGKYHPDYHKISTEVRQLKRKIELLDSVQAFKKAEDKLDSLLYQVSRIIADSVSDTIKVPSNNPFLEAKSSGCGSGGSCGCSIRKTS
ncbi:YlbF family regulator [Brevibacillus fulvus]|uniref:Cell fate (Sporulation/competence/biofilm development) regulator YlbF (YheA/YmcA/DUF963 family) n=1 Tax=Brevibacillus fulvus TaxID=1125967 RepID=A0A939BQM7_9BACL|nr:YlbF family regulator [Brevibacillus fulvus]MBM7588543.1 cell fate (sporulation/competence/biofilm development) regulator YlbF (YheA/YmcA/DUF963 family) [Brevibacillus fulvus]